MPKKNKDDSKPISLTIEIYEHRENELRKKRNMRSLERNQQNNENEAAELCGDEAPQLDGSGPDFPSLNGAVNQDQNRSDAIPVPAQQVPLRTRTWKQVLKGESSTSGKSQSRSNPTCPENPPDKQITSTPSSNADEISEDTSSKASATAAVNSDLHVENPPENQITSTSSNADETSEDTSSNGAATVAANLYVDNPSEQQITSTSSNAGEPPEDPSSNAAAAVNSNLDAGQASATIESSSTSTTMSISEPEPEPHHTPASSINTPNDWSPQDDGIEVLLPGSDKALSREEFDAYISSLSGGLRRLTRTKRRLPVFEQLCKGKE